MKVPYQVQLVPFLALEHRKFVAMKVPFVPVPVPARSSGVAMAAMTASVISTTSGVATQVAAGLVLRRLLRGGTPGVSFNILSDLKIWTRHTDQNGVNGTHPPGHAFSADGEDQRAGARLRQIRIDTPWTVVIP